jgi:hypothetical protein
MTYAWWARSERLGAKAVFWERPAMTYVIHNITLVIPNIHYPADHSNHTNR